MSFTSRAISDGDEQEKSFNREKDLLLVQFDCKTDVDDLQTVAAMATMLSDSNFNDINYHAVAGTYGIQDGLYVPPNTLFQLAFEDNWTDAHNNFLPVVKKVTTLIEAILNKDGDIWIAEAGQSDFTGGYDDIPLKGMGEIHPIAWCQEYEGGKSFYTAIGHKPESYKDEAFLKHIFGAIYWVKGN